MAVAQELILERHWTCNLCGNSGVETSETPQPHEALGVYCCGCTRVREVPGQLLFSDEGGAWIRRKARSS
jgi:hypothetical protein